MIGAIIHWTMVWTLVAIAVPFVWVVCTRANMAWFEWRNFLQADADLSPGELSAFRVILLFILAPSTLCVIVVTTPAFLFWDLTKSWGASKKTPLPKATIRRK